MKTVVRILAGLTALLALPAFASFHLWQMSELYSNADGSVQFLELRALAPSQQFLSGHSISASANGVTNTFSFENDLSGETSGKTFLIGTQSFANLHLVAPDFIVPDHFFFPAGGSVNFGPNADTWTHGALPSGTQSLNRDGSTGVNSPKNFAGTTGSVPASTPATAFNVEALWWNDPDNSEPGWGVNVIHHGNILFVSWFTYDADGSMMWLFMSSATQSATNVNSYSGDVIRSTGAPFSNYNPATFHADLVGTGTFTFRDAGHGTFSYIVNGVTQTKNIKRYEFGALPTCDQSGAVATNFTDLWWKSPANSESGWGVNLVQQGDLIFASWFTYDATGKGLWIYGSNIARTTGNTFTGPIATNTGPPFNTVPWDATRVHPTVVGSATFAFTDANNGTFSYTVNGVTQSKPITRDVYALPATTCR
jgi:hypothetical protein